MPQGKGTYGSKVGRPSKKSKAKGKSKSKKKLSPKQKKIAKKAAPYNKITGADFKKMKK
jgi:hypothetical protein